MTWCKRCFLEEYKCDCWKFEPYDDEIKHWQEYKTKPHRRPYGLKHRTCTGDIMADVDNCIHMFESSFLAKYIYEKNGWIWDHDNTKCKCNVCWFENPRYNLDFGE